MKVKKVNYYLLILHLNILREKKRKKIKNKIGKKKHIKTINKKYSNKTLLSKSILINNIVKSG